MEQRRDQDDTHACVICPKPIPTRLLMCAAHWRLVPAEQQRAVYSTWGALQRAHPSASEVLTLRFAYYKARERAIETVKATFDVGAMQQ